MPRDAEQHGEDSLIEDILEAISSNLGPSQNYWLYVEILLYTIGIITVSAMILSFR